MERDADGRSPPCWPCCGPPRRAIAAPIPSRATDKAAPGVSHAERAAIEAALARQEVADALAAHGLSAEEVEQRVAQLSAEDLSGARRQPGPDPGCRRSAELHLDPAGDPDRRDDPGHGLLAVPAWIGPSRDARSWRRSGWPAFSTSAASRSRPHRGRRAPRPSVLDHVPVRAFDDDQCGPGSLSVVLNGLGDAVSEEELAAKLPRAPGGGVLSVDLLLAARQRGFVRLTRRRGRRRGANGDPGGASRHSHAEDAERPWARDGTSTTTWSWTATIRAAGSSASSSGTERPGGPPSDRLEGAWKGSGHAMVTVSAPPELVRMRAAVDLERAGRLDDAAELYSQLLEANPESRRSLGEPGQRGGRARATAGCRTCLPSRAVDLAG